MAGAALAAPQRLQVAVEDPEVPVAVLHEDFAAAGVAREIEEGDRVAVGPLVVRTARGGLRHVRVAGDLGQLGRALHLAGAAVEHLQLESPCTCTTSPRPVAVEVVNLERRVAGEQAVARIGPAELPEHFAVERDGGEATDLDGRVADDLGHVLADEHVDRAVAVEVAEPHIAAGAEFGRGEFFPQLGLGVGGLQAAQLVAGVSGWRRRFARWFAA